MELDTFCFSLKNWTQYFNNRTHFRYETDGSVSLRYGYRYEIQFFRYGVQYQVISDPISVFLVCSDEGVDMTTLHTSCEFSMAKMCTKIHGSAGPSGVDAVMLRLWCLYFGTASCNLKQELGIWLEWLSDESPLWAAIRALNAAWGCNR
jgi:hypothetical protein